MGQRLNLEILKGEEVIANAYYHWSGYTDSALELTKCVIHKLQLSKEQKAYEGSPDVEILRAVNALHETGAKLPSEEQSFIQTSSLDEQTKLILLRQVAAYQSTVDRSDGLVAISAEQNASTQAAAEFTVTIQYTDLTVDFGVLDSYEDKDELRDSYEMDEDDLSDIPVLKTDVNTSNMTTLDIENLEAALQVASQHAYSCFQTPDGMCHSVID